MAPACRCLGDNSSFSYMTISCPQPLRVILGRPDPPRPRPAKQKERRIVIEEKDRENKGKYSLGRARPPLLLFRFLTLLLSRPYRCPGG